MDTLTAMTEREAVVLSLALRAGKYPDWEPLGWSPFPPDPERRVVMVRHRPSGVRLFLADARYVTTWDARAVLAFALPYFGPADRYRAVTWLARAQAEAGRRRPAPDARPGAREE